MIFELNSKIDLEELLTIDEEGLSSYLLDPFTVSTGVVRDDNGEIVVIGFVRIVNEFKIIVNKKKSNYFITKAITWLLSKALDYCHSHGSNEIYGFITQGGEHYEKLLQKHFNFNKINATTLRMDL